MHKFQNSLQRGKAGEDLFHALNPTLVKTDGRSGDFLNEAGEKIELKTDSYDPYKSGNFFIERFSNKLKCTPGGPWQAKEHGCKWFIYFFSKNNLYYVFDVSIVVDELDNILKTSSLKPTDVMNTRYTTEGFKVPRKALLAVCERIVVHPSYKPTIVPKGTVHEEI